MISTEQEQALRAVRLLWQQYPSFRLGQMVCNVALWARNPDPESIWDMEDEEVINTIRDHLLRRTGRDIFAESEPATTNNET